MFGKGEICMTNVILFDFLQKKDYCLKKLADDFEKVVQDDNQGIILHEFDNNFLKASYWQRKSRKEYRYNLSKMEFEIVDDEVVNIADFVIQIADCKLLVFGNKQMAQKIITLIGIVSNNSYSITEYIINIDNLIKRICKDDDVELIKMKLVDIIIDKGLLVNCSVNLMAQDNPMEIVLKYVNNIVMLSFRLDKIATNITVYKSGKFSVSKVSSEDKDEMIQKMIQIVC